MKTPEQQAEAVRLAREWSSKHVHDEVEGALAFHSFMEGHDVGYQSAKELYASKLEEANATIDGLADECEGLKSILYDHDETNLPTPAKWISVKDRLPEIEQSSFAMRKESACVLIVSNGNVHVAHLCEKWCDRTQLIFEACDCDCRGHDMEQDEWELDQVTHWMPLPEPPKEEK